MADALSRAPVRLGHALHAIRLSDFSAPNVTKRIGVVRAVEETMSQEATHSMFFGDEQRYCWESWPSFRAARTAGANVAR